MSDWRKRSTSGPKFNDHVGDFGVDCMQIDMMAGHFSHRRRVGQDSTSNSKRQWPVENAVGKVKQNDPTDSEERDQRVASLV